MKSPFANCEAQIVREVRTVKFRGDDYTFVHSCYECEKTHERFTTTEMDEENVQQVYRQYRAKYGIPTSEEIEGLKQKYCVSSARLSLILGFGENQISNYLDGEIPNKANGKTLSAIKDPYVFGRYVELAKEQLKPTVYKKLSSLVDGYKSLGHKEELKVAEPAITLQSEDSPD